MYERLNSPYSADILMGHTIGTMIRLCLLQDSYWHLPSRSPSHSIENKTLERLLVLKSSWERGLQDCLSSLTGVRKPSVSTRALPHHLGHLSCTNVAWGSHKTPRRQELVSLQNYELNERVSFINCLVFTSSYRTGKQTESQGMYERSAHEIFANQ